MGGRNEREGEVGTSKGRRNGTRKIEDDKRRNKRRRGDGRK